MLAITPEQFDKIYANTTLIAYKDLFYSNPKDENDLITNYMPSKLWRLNNLYTIVNKHGDRVRFNMRLAQHKVYAASLRHPRIIILKSRQQGISTMWLISFFDDAVTRPDFSIGLMAQGTDEASTLLERTKLLWDALDNNVKALFKVQIGKDNTKEFSLSNNSKIFVRTSFRSTALQRLHISEMGKIANKYPEKAMETKTGTLQAIAQGNTTVIESTAEGANLFKTMWDNAMKYQEQLSLKDFYPVFLPWVDDPDCVSEVDQVITPKHAEYFDKIELELQIKLTRQQKNFWIVQFRELGTKIYQEYPATPTEAFLIDKDGAYYARLYLLHVVLQKREKKNLYDPNLDVQVAIDIGMDDTNVLVAFQYYTDGFRVIDEMYDSGKKISYYTDALKSKPYFKNITRVILPHDAQVRDHDSGKSRLESYTEALEYADKQCTIPTNIHVDMLEKTDKLAGIEEVRQIMDKLYIDPEKCPFLIESFYNYSKEWDDKRERWKDGPYHDKWSNPADAIRYMVVGAFRGTATKNEQLSQKLYGTVRNKNQGHDV